MTKIKVSLAMLALFVGLAVTVNVSGLGKGEKRDCGKGIHSVSVAAHALWAGGQVTIHGNLGPAPFSKERAQASPYKAAGQACPGELISINVQAIRGPLPSILCKLWMSGHQLTGDSIKRTNVSGKRAYCEAVVK